MHRTVRQITQKSDRHPPQGWAQQQIAIGNIPGRMMLDINTSVGLRDRRVRVLSPPSCRHEPCRNRARTLSPGKASTDRRPALRWNACTATIVWWPSVPSLCAEADSSAHNSDPRCEF